MDTGFQEVEPVDSGSAGTVSRVRWNGIAGPLERYRGSAGTVSRVRWNGIKREAFGAWTPSWLSVGAAPLGPSSQRARGCHECRN